MTARVDPRRLGRAFGAHGVAGNLGWVAAPASVLGLTALFGWRAALVILGGVGLALALYLLSQRALLSGETRTGPLAARRQVEAGAGLRVLLAPSVLLCFAYFTLLSIAQVGLQFLPVGGGGVVRRIDRRGERDVDRFSVAAALGVLAGGIVADRFPRHELVVGIGLAVAAGLNSVFATAALPVAVLASCAGVAGFAMGATMPARDMIVRGAAPAGGTGKVFGFVYSGLHLGGAITPPLLGLLLDWGMPRMVFATSALAFAVAIGSAVVVGREPRARGAVPVAGGAAVTPDRRRCSLVRAQNPGAGGPDAESGGAPDPSTGRGGPPDTSRESGSGADGIRGWKFTSGKRPSRLEYAAFVASCEQGAIPSTRAAARRLSRGSRTAKGVSHADTPGIHRGRARAADQPLLRRGPLR